MFKVKLLYLFLITLIFPARFSLSIGEAIPNGTYEAYSTMGNHYKFNFQHELENVSLENINISYGVQYMYFGEDIITNGSWGGVEIREGERSTMFDVGLRYTHNEGIFGNGVLRPYVNTSLGLAFFKQYTVYDYPTTFDPCSNYSCDSFIGCLFELFLDLADGDTGCEPGYNNNDEYITDDSMSSPYFSLDIGANIHPAHNSPVAIDIGIKYNSLSRIDKIEYHDFDTNDIPQVFDDIGKKIDADYSTVYLGVSWLLD